MMDSFAQQRAGACFLYIGDGKMAMIGGEGAEVNAQGYIDLCPIHVKYGFHNKSFILNAPLVSCPIPVIRFGWVCCCTHPERMTGIGQLTRGAFRINDLL